MEAVKCVTTAKKWTHKSSAVPVSTPSMDAYYRQVSRSPLEVLYIQLNCLACGAVNLLYKEESARLFTLNLNILIWNTKISLWLNKYSPKLKFNLFKLIPPKLTSLYDLFFIFYSFCSFLFHIFVLFLFCNENFIFKWKF